MNARQCSDTILMIRPLNFRFNEQTAVNNYYQRVLDNLNPEEVQLKAAKEFDDLVNKLRSNGVNIITIDDTPAPDKPDAIFPNNWISFHDDGRVGLYPMFAHNRRMERRDEILAVLEKEYRLKISGIEDFSFYEHESKFLESTGSLVLDRTNRLAYAALSYRTNEEVVDHFCRTFGFSPVKFSAYQTIKGKRVLIYHTNVMICVATDFAVICIDAIDDPEEREHVLTMLKKSGKEIIEISEDQKYFFAGNMLQVSAVDGEKYLVMSTAAYHALHDEQIKMITKHCCILHSSLDTIEALGGGSARCMMAEIFLPSKDQNNVDL